MKISDVNNLLKDFSVKSLTRNILQFSQRQTSLKIQALTKNFFHMHFHIQHILYELFYTFFEFIF